MAALPRVTLMRPAPAQSPCSWLPGRWCGSGKTVATYQPSMDMGAYVVIVNAEKVVVTGNKFTQKVYTRHTGRPGSRKEETFQKLQAVRRSAACTCAAAAYV